MIYLLDIKCSEHFNTKQRPYHSLDVIESKDTGTF